MTTSEGMSVIALGAHILDTLVTPVEAIPDGQAGVVVDRIRMTAAGPAGGTALVLAKLGATVRSAGAIGTDPIGDLLLALLNEHNIDTDLLVRRTEAQTSASVVPVRPDGSHPSLHVIGANGAYTLDDVPWDAIRTATHLHLGAPELLGGEAAGKILSFAREHGVVTSVDCLVPGEPSWLEWIEACLPHVDHLLPNDDQVTGWTGTASLLEGCRQLRERGVRTVAATAGAAGAVVVSADGEFIVPALPTDVVDTTGCGDAFSAGYLRALSLGKRPEEAAVLGCAVAAQVAAGLGTDHGDFTLESLLSA
ncbi:carbohydrate kinase family protein [Actinoplanes couchii]|uniref:Sugar kinase n=1 Tax=Actinoplanes couchii TaxID=403638 RepID=A0ABQ3XLL8_9ACTN|nr:PfkB family carbohydrate kinase [Actinoplanes couchii]MDR6318240.1 sugar/nucleoside kinase (ribokinase family) [Actinoplanes couchii]GID59389.1 sugar kinase [Actinoplanes couchii]